MIRLITATPGSGKTCLVVEWLLKEIKRGFYKEFYTNIEGLQIDGVRPLPDDCDWRTLNPNKDPNEPPKLVIIDECQYIDAFMKENRSAHNRIGKDLSTHRHYGIDIWFITQSVKLLNDYVLENVGEHVHLYRPRKKKNVTIYWWSYVQKSLTKSAFKDADDMQVWRINPAMFKYYKSTSAVTDDKSRVSKKVVNTLITFTVIIAIIVYFVSKGLDFYTSADVDQVTGSNEAIESVVKTDDIFSTDTDSVAKDLEVKPRQDEDEENLKADEHISNESSNQKAANQISAASFYVPPPAPPAPAPPAPAPPAPASQNYLPPLSDNNFVSLLVPSVFDDKPVMIFLNEEKKECTASNIKDEQLDLTFDECEELLFTVVTD